MTTPRHVLCLRDLAKNRVSASVSVLEEHDAMLTSLLQLGANIIAVVGCSTSDAMLTSLLFFGCSTSDAMLLSLMFLGCSTPDAMLLSLIFLGCSTSDAMLLSLMFLGCSTPDAMLLSLMFLGCSTSQQHTRCIPRTEVNMTLPPFRYAVEGVNDISTFHLVYGRGE